MVGQVLAPAFKEALGWEPIAPQGSMYGMFKHTEASDIEALQKGTFRFFLVLLLLLLLLLLYIIIIIIIIIIVIVTQFHVPVNGSSFVA